MRSSSTASGFTRTPAWPGPAARPVEIPVLASALRRASFRLCGELTDGALTWVCPPPYLRDVALPALREGAERAGRPAPALIAHIPVAVHENVDEVRQAVRSQFSIYPRSPNYQRMFADAGFPGAVQGEWTEAMIDAVVVYDAEASVCSKLGDILAMGMSEIIAHPVLASPDRDRALSRVLQTLGDLAST